MMTKKEAKEWGNWIKNSVYNDGKEEGIEENTINTIKNMLNNNYEVEEIMKITNKSKEEILKIKEKM